MTDSRLSKEDSDSLRKFTSFFISQAAQIIVQSRLGEKKSTKSRAGNSGTGWFYLSIKDIPEVTISTKKCLGGASHLLDSPHSPFSLEISLQTPDCDTIPLETWCISFDQSISDPSQRVRFNIYNRMSLVLRSLLVCTRSTPTYQLSRKQSPDKYIIFYKMYTGEPIIDHLGVNHSNKIIGHILTPIGRLSLTVAYRTNSAMAQPQMNSITNFEISSNPKDNYLITNRIDDQNSVEYNSNTSKIPSIQITKQNPMNSDNRGASDKIHHNKVRAAFATPSTPSHIGFNLQTNDNDLPFVLMMQQQDNNDQQSQNYNEIEQNSKTGDDTSEESDNELAPDDFLLVEVKPFYGRSEATDDLALLIRSCQQPPMLESCKIDGSLGETINQLNEELRIFESKVEEFDQLVNDLEATHKASLFARE